MAAIGVGRYVMLPLDRIAQVGAGDRDWSVVDSPSDPVEIALP